MTRILLVQDDPILGDTILTFLRSRAAVELEYALTGRLGAKLIVGGRFDIALINATLPDISGITLAKLAANENTEVLMLSESPDVSRELKRLDYRFLEKPFGLDVLLSESMQLMLERETRISQFRSSAAIIEATLETLRAEVAEAHRAFDAIVMHLGHLKR